MITIREALPEDAELILHYVKELAIYEKAEHEVVATEAMILRSIFAEDSTAHAIICEHDGQPIGFAVYFYNYSTWLARNGLYLEDLFITAKARGLGAGKAMLKYLAKLALEKGCGRFEWSVLDWNTPAIEFYQSLGAQPQEEWLSFRLTGQKLKELADVLDQSD